VKLHPILPGYWCVPSALMALTGLDGESVIQPALNRHMERGGLLDLVTGATMRAAQRSLEEFGYRVRRYRGKEPLGAQVRTWAQRSIERWPGRALLIATHRHAMVIQDGRVYDTWTPHGALGGEHPFAKTRVDWAALVEAPLNV
jgi:hypothetical protein